MSKWICPDCTLINLISEKNCQACGRKSDIPREIVVDLIDKACREDENTGLRRQKTELLKREGPEKLAQWEKTWGRWAQER